MAVSTDSSFQINDDLEILPIFNSKYWGLLVTLLDNDCFFEVHISVLALLNEGSTI